MPRHARLDTPGTRHHVMVRGLERGAIVRDATDRAAFVARLGAVAQATETVIYAWALLPNHAHLLLRSGVAGLPPFMRRLLTGYTITFNRRHRRVGYHGDERILGSSDFVEDYRRGLAAAAPAPTRIALAALITRVCRHVGLPPTALPKAARRGALTAAAWQRILPHGQES